MNSIVEVDSLPQIALVVPKDIRSRDIPTQVATDESDIMVMMGNDRSWPTIRVLQRGMSSFTSCMSSQVMSPGGMLSRSFYPIYRNTIQGLYASTSRSWAQMGRWPGPSVSPPSPTQYRSASWNPRLASSRCSLINSPTRLMYECPTKTTVTRLTALRTPTYCII